MGRRRRRYRVPRRNRNLSWQSTYGWKEITFPTSVGVHNFYLEEFHPGVTPEGGGNPENFENEHVLERVRGSLVHDIIGAESPSNDDVVQFVMAAFILPVEFGGTLADADMPNLFSNGDGDDYPLYEMGYCRPYGAGVAIQHPVDSKAKRRLHVGSRVVTCCSTIVNKAINTGSPKIQLAWNLRWLWKLG